MRWQRYGDGRDTGVRAFALLPDGIALRFRESEMYVYDTVQPGAEHVRQMRLLAEEGRGLTTYVNRFVRERYRRKVG